MASRYSRYTPSQPRDTTTSGTKSYRPVLDPAERERERELAAPSLTTIERRHQNAVAELEGEIDFLCKRIRQEMDISADLKNQIRDILLELQDKTDELVETEELLHRQDLSLSKQRQWNQRLEAENVQLRESYETAASENKTMKASVRNFERQHQSLTAEATRLKERLRVIIGMHLHYYIINIIC